MSVLHGKSTVVAQLSSSQSYWNKHGAAAQLGQDNLNKTRESRVLISRFRSKLCTSSDVSTTFCDAPTLQASLITFSLLTAQHLPIKLTWKRNYIPKKTSAADTSNLLASQQIHPPPPLWNPVVHNFVHWNRNDVTSPYTRNLITVWSRVLLEKLTGSQLVEKPPAVYATRNFTTTLTSPLPIPIPSQINPGYFPI
jgi:hypothetical protein